MLNKLHMAMIELYRGDAKRIILRERTIKYLSRLISLSILWKMVCQKKRR